MPARFRCPRCDTIAEFAEGQPRECGTCGFPGEDIRVPRGEGWWVDEPAPRATSTAPGHSTANQVVAGPVGQATPEQRAVMEAAEGAPNPYDEPAGDVPTPQDVGAPQVPVPHDPAWEADAPSDAMWEDDAPQDAAVDDPMVTMSLVEEIPSLDPGTQDTSWTREEPRFPMDLDEDARRPAEVEVDPWPPVPRSPELPEGQARKIRDTLAIRADESVLDAIERELVVRGSFAGRGSIVLTNRRVHFAEKVMGQGHKRVTADLRDIHSAGYRTQIHVTLLAFGGLLVASGVTGILWGYAMGGLAFALGIGALPALLGGVMMTMATQQVAVVGIAGREHIITMRGVPKTRIQRFMDSILAQKDHVLHR